uniref:hypothetical protein n=1 Tax=Kocuria marina TaxID=223184 RepID=UPI0022E7AAAD
THPWQEPHAPQQLGVITGLRPFGDPIGGNQRAPLKRHVGQMIVLCLGQSLVQLGAWAAAFTQQDVTNHDRAGTWKRP